MKPEFTSLVDSDGVRISDHIERTQFDLHAPSAVSPELTDMDAFYFPVDTAVAVRTRSLRTTKGLDVYVRDVDGDLVGQSSGGSELTLPSDAYNLELANTQMKVYLAVESPGLRALHGHLCDEFDPVEGIEGDDYIPHVTIARGGGPAAARRLTERAIDPIEWTVEELVCYDSERGQPASRLSLPA
jgi:hypothetical protein